MLKNILLPIGVVTGLIVIATFFLGRYRWRTKICNLESILLKSIEDPIINKVDFTSFTLLPMPVARYLKYALVDGQPIITTTKMQQAGLLRTSTTTNKWLSFTATQLVVPAAPGFIWSAKVAVLFRTYINVLDTYVAGVGSGRVSFLSAVNIASDADSPELNAGALHRYLAEAVWYPTALLPESGVVWTAINNQTALATIKTGEVSVSLEFRFNPLGEVTGIYSPGRFRKMVGGYEKTPWEGRFHGYTTQAGMRIPTYGEVGWYELGIWQGVWKGNINDIQFAF